MIELILLCLGTACLSHFLEMCMEEGMVLHWYYIQIERLPEVLFNPLGGCVYCFGTWVYVIISGIVSYKFGIKFDFIGFILGIGLNFIFIKAIHKYVV